MALYFDHCFLAQSGSPVPEQNKTKYCPKQCPLKKRSILNEIQSFAKPRDKAGENKLVLGLENTYFCHEKMTSWSKWHKTGLPLMDLWLQTQECRLQRFVK